MTSAIYPKNYPKLGLYLVYSNDLSNMNKQKVFNRRTEALIL